MDTRVSFLETNCSINASTPTKCPNPGVADGHGRLSETRRRPQPSHGAAQPSFQSANFGGT